MNNKKPLILAVVLLILVALIYLPKLLPEKRSYPARLAQIDTTQVTRIYLTSRKDTLDLRKVDSEWKIYSPAKLPVEGYRMDRVLRSLAGLRVTALVTSRPERSADFEVTDTLAQGVAVYSDASPEPVRFLVGKASQDFRHSYARLAGSKQVLEVAENLTSAFNLSAGNVFRHQLYSFDAEELKQVEIKGVQDRKESLKLERAEPFRLTDYSDREVAVDSSAAARYFQSIHTLRDSSLILPEDEKPEQVAEKVLEAVLTTTDGKQVEIAFYNDPDDEKKFIVTTSEFPYRFRAAEYVLKNFRKKAADLAPKEEK